MLRLALLTFGAVMFATVVVFGLATQPAYPFPPTFVTEADCRTLVPWVNGTIKSKQRAKITRWYKRHCN